MLFSLLRLLGRLPLGLLHAVGAALGWIVYMVSPVYAARMRDNLHASAIYTDPGSERRALRTCIGEIGKSIVEITKVWFDDPAKVEALARCDSWHVVEEAQRAGRGMIFLTPHLGCFEIAGFYVAQRVPLTVLYRPPRQRWLEPLMLEGRRRGQAKLAPANLKGVRLLYKALQRGDSIGMLPDQAPQMGEGAWADFFGRPAYTITLVRRLQKQTGAAVLLVYAERLPHSLGYQVHFERYADTELDETRLNRAIEDLIRRCPTQYLWSYNRYKVPKGAVAPSVTLSDGLAPPPTPPRQRGGE
jgi:KDO2-lipid IV(A) lauroyltransferase